MARFDAIVGGMIHSHDSLQQLLSRASTASVHLCMNPANETADQQWQTALCFVRSAVGHMGEEEAGAFVEAEESGVPPHVMDALRAEHAKLRVLAAELLHREGPDDEGALLLLRFLDRFERHVAQEEWSLTSRLERDGSPLHRLRRRR